MTKTPYEVCVFIVIDGDMVTNSMYAGTLRKCCRNVLIGKPAALTLSDGVTAAETMAVQIRTTEARRSAFIGSHYVHAQRLAREVNRLFNLNLVTEDDKGSPIPLRFAILADFHCMGSRHANGILFLQEMLGLFPEQLRHVCVASKFPADLEEAKKAGVPNTSKMGSYMSTVKGLFLSFIDGDSWELLIGDKEFGFQRRPGER